MSSFNESTVSIERIAEVLNNDLSEYRKALKREDKPYNVDYTNGAIDAIKAVATSLGIHLNTDVKEK